MVLGVVQDEAMLQVFESSHGNLDKLSFRGCWIPFVHTGAFKLWLNGHMAMHQYFM